MSLNREGDRRRPPIEINLLAEPGSEAGGLGAWLRGLLSRLLPGR